MSTPASVHPTTTGARTPRRVRRASGWRLGRFAVASAAIGLAAVVTFVVGQALGGSVPSGWLGIGFGIGAVVLLAGVMAYSARRSVPAVRGLGPARTYLQIHLYGGALFFLFVLLHIGFRWPTGVLDTLLWFLTLWVVLTGALGVALQRWVPRMLRSGPGTEINLARIPELCEQLGSRAQELASEAGDDLRRFHGRQLAPLLATPRPMARYYAGLTRDPHGIEGTFDRLGRTLDAADRTRLDELHEIYRSKVDIDVHLTLQRALRIWLTAHLPVAIAMIALLGLHIFLALYF